MTGGADTNRHTVYYDPNNGKTSQKILYVGLMKKERGQWVPHGKRNYAVRQRVFSDGHLYLW